MLILAAQLYVYRKRAACASFLHRWKLLTRADGRLAAASVYRVLDGRRRVVEDALMYWRWYAAVEIRQALWRNAASLGIQSRLQASVLRWRRVRHTSLKPANVAFHLTACIMLLSFVIEDVDAKKELQDLSDLVAGSTARHLAGRQLLHSFGQWKRSHAELVPPVLRQLRRAGRRLASA
ncbi:MAG: hypothetical protein SGPRY_007041, partial [Prymnesium sp.]